MTDLVERLRSQRRATKWKRGVDIDYPVEFEPDPLCAEAADEITRLRAEVEALRADAERMRASFAAIHCRVCYGSATFGMGEVIASECEHAVPELKVLRP